MKRERIKSFMTHDVCVKKRRFLISGFLSLLFVLCFLFSGCGELGNNVPGESIPFGMGYVRLSVKDLKTRTIMPGAVKDDFAEYKLVFHDTDTDDIVETYILLKNELSDPIYLEPGNYYVLVTAYLGTGQINPAATGRLNNINIIEGYGNDYEVTLKGILDNGSGTFSWNIAFSPGITLNTLDMTITPLSANGTDEQTLNLLQRRTGTETLNSGYYSIIFNIKKTNNEEIIWRYVLHVNQNLTSPFIHTFTEEHFNNLFYTVTYIFNNGVINGTENVQHGEQADEPPDPVWDKGEFLGWYTDPGTFQDKYDFDTVLTGNIILFARWQVDTDFIFNWDFNDYGPVLFFDNQPLPDDFIPVRQGEKIIFTVTNAPIFSGGSIKWYFDNEYIASGAIFIFNSDIYDITGTKLLTVEADKDGIRYSSSVEIKGVQAHTVTFNPNNGSLFMFEYVKWNEPVPEPADPIKTMPPPEPGLYLMTLGAPACTFDGWFFDDGSTLVLFDFDTPIKENITLIAQWTDAAPINISGHLVEQAFTYVNNTTNATRGPYTLFIDQDYTNNNSRSLSISNSRLTIEGFDGNECIIQFTGTASSSLFTISSTTAVLTLGNNITLKGLTNGTSSLVSVSGGTLNMRAGSKITGHTSTGANAAVSLSSGSFNMQGGEITGNSVDVYVSSTTTGALTLSGSAKLDNLMLNASLTAFTTVTVNNWTGSTNLHLRGAVASLDTVVSYWEFNQIIRAATGYTLTGHDLTRFIPGNFVSNAATNNTRPINNTHYIANQQLNVGIGVLMLLNAQPPIVNTQPVGEIYIEGCTIILPLNITMSGLQDGGVLSYQWYINDINNNTGGDVIPGETTVRFVPDISLGSKYYYCVITNSNILSIGDQVISSTSNVVFIEVKQLSDATVYLDVEGVEDNIPFYDLDVALRLITNSSTMRTVTSSAITAGNYKLRIKENQPITGRSLGTYSFSSSRNVTLIADNPSNPVEIRSSASIYLFYVSGAGLTLGNGVTIMGRGMDSATSYPLIYIVSSGILNMNEGSKITGNRNTTASSSYLGGGVYNAGTLNMNGGEISGNAATGSGGGVYVASNGITNIGGSARIINNTRGTGAGAPANNLFLFSGRTITINTPPASNMQVGVAAYAPINVMANGASAGNEAYFTSDDSNLSIVRDNDTLRWNVLPGSRLVVINMFDSYGNGWDGSGAIRINVNGIDVANNIKVHTSLSGGVNISGSATSNTYYFTVQSGDDVQFYWVAGTAQGENSFVAYYHDTPPSPVFSPVAANNWNGSNALIFRLYNSMNTITGGTLLDNFTVP